LDSLELHRLQKQIKAEQKRLKKQRKSHDAEEDNEAQEDQEEEDSDLEIVNRDLAEKGKLMTFVEKVNNVEKLNERLGELQSNFYNRLSRNRVTKKKGKIPWVEHFSVVNEHELDIPEELAVHDDLKRELAL